MPNQGVIANVNAALILKVTAGIDENIFPDVNVPPKIGIKRRKQPEAFIHFLSYQFRHDKNYFFRRMVLGI